jgi:hypothetical protein
MMVSSDIMLFLQELKGTEIFKTTDILPPNIRVGPSNATPNDLNMNLIQNEFCSYS